MPIQSEDIKLVKSAVMADTTDGGGAMTGVEIVGGQSNNMFPDSSEIDRAIGRWQARKVFGVAQSADTDTLMGAHAILTEAPGDPLVNCLLMEASDWAETRDAARLRVERFLVKGPRFGCRLLDNHYAGTLVVRLFSMTGTDFPAGGEVLVLSQTGVGEQYLRILKIAVSNETFTVLEGSSTVTFNAFVATCDLGSELAYDFNGPPAARAMPVGAWALPFSTSAAAGAQFFGVKKLTASAALGDYEVIADGIFAPLVPAATLESPLIDQYPLAPRQGVHSTANSALSYTAIVALNPGISVQLMTPVQPGTLAATRAGLSLVDDFAGVVKDGSTAVANIDYATGLLTFLATSPAYGVAGTTFTYRPATASQASTKSAYDEVTLLNQGLSWVRSIKPAPAPGTLVVSYMAQGRWYSLQDTGGGKMAGADSSYGAGTMSYSSGSVSLTLGALPDVGSGLLYQWGEAYGAVDGIPLVTMPDEFEALIPLDAYTDLGSIVVTWSAGANNYTATTNSSGTLSGHATGKVLDGVLHFRPSVKPTSGVVQVAWTSAPVPQDTYTGSGNNLTLSATPVRPGTVRFNLGVVAQSYYELPGTLAMRDDGVGNIISVATGTVVGGINYATGAITMASTMLYSRVVYYGPGDTAPIWPIPGMTDYQRRVVANRTVSFSGVHSGVQYGTGTPVAHTENKPLAWSAQIPVGPGWGVVPNGLTFMMGGELYTCAAGNLRRGVDLSVAVAAGSVSSSGVVSVTSLPANGSTTPTWINVALDLNAERVASGVFRTASAPLKPGVFQIMAGSSAGSADGAGDLSGDGFGGWVDAQRGVVFWERAPGDEIDASAVTYNTVFLQAMPLDPELLGLDTARLPLDGRVPIFKNGMLVVVHHTAELTLASSITKGVDYSLGRARVAAVEVRDSLKVLVPSGLYDVNHDAASVNFKTGSDLAGYTQPFKVKHRIEDIAVLTEADISGRLRFTRSLTHNYPAEESFVSGALVFGDVFARAYNYIEQTTWTGAWSDSRIGGAPTANFNEAVNPIVVTNAGSIRERWAAIFTNTTSFRIVGESVGQIIEGSTGGPCAPINPSTGVPYFTIPAAGWGSGWATGNVLRFNTDACGRPFWVARTILQGPATLASDQFTLAFRGDVDTP
ncbi:MAG: hypothetical protein J0H69_19500 [Burkholderiales bacterium]|nr:hypothetical protein [Burkholderiales bacterium]